MRGRLLCSTIYKRIVYFHRVKNLISACKTKYVMYGMKWYLCKKMQDLLFYSSGLGQNFLFNYFP